MMNQEQIKDIIREVLTEVLSQQDSKPSPSEEPARKLADENLARWLGYTPQKRKTSELQPKLKESPKVESSNSIPQPRKPEKLDALLKTTPARLGVWRAGTRYLTSTVLKFRADHAVAKDAVYAELPDSFASGNGWIALQTKAKSKEEFLLRPDLGRQLDDNSLTLVKEKGTKNCDIQITVADGLSAWAAERYAKPMIDEISRLFKQAGLSIGTIFCVKYSRIAIQDVIGQTVGAKISMILLGERPGLGTGDSLSNYMIFDPQIGAVNARKSMISNIHPLGHTPQEAARLTFEMVKKMLDQKCSGIALI